MEVWGPSQLPIGMHVHVGTHQIELLVFDGVKWCERAMSEDETLMVSIFGQNKKQYSDDGYEYGDKPMYAGKFDVRLQDWLRPKAVGTEPSNSRTN